MVECKGWTITGTNGGGVLRNGERSIHWGSSTYASNNTLDWCRVDLTDMIHGVALDTAEHTIPRFIAAADRIHQLLKTSSNVTVHCAAGRSRTSMTLMVFLMRHYKCSWEQAAPLIVEGQTERAICEDGFEFDLERKGVNGSYAEWIKQSDKPSGLLRDMKASASFMDAYTYSYQKDNKTVYAIDQQIDPLAPRRKRRRSAGARNAPVEAEPPPSKRRKNADKLAIEEGEQLLANFPLKAAVRKSGFRR